MISDQHEAAPARIERSSSTGVVEAPPAGQPSKRRWPLRAFLVTGVAAGVAGALLAGMLSIDIPHFGFAASKPLAESVGRPGKVAAPRAFKPTNNQWASLAVETVQEMPFRTTLVTDGKIAINDDLSTPVYSPYIGRVTKLFAKPGDKVEAGKPLFAVDASDMVQGQNDFLAAKATLNKAQSQLSVSEIILKRHRELMIGNAIAKRDLEQAEIGSVTAINDFKAAEVALEAARNRLRILGKTDVEIQAFEGGGQRISAETIVPSPITGTVVQRKAGPGQLINGASTDPVYTIGDLSMVWVIANLRETDAGHVKVGQPIEFTILAAPDRIFTAKVEYVWSSLNPELRRLQARAAVDNADGILRPEMFANVTLITSEEKFSAGVPRHAVIYEGEETRVWTVREDRSIELRKFVPGIVAGGFMQVRSGLAAGEKIITRGSLFIDRVAAPVVSENN